MSQPSSEENLKALLYTTDAASYNARYHVATLPSGRARLWAVNPDKNDAAGNPVWSSWFHKQDAAHCLANLMDEQEDRINKGSEGAKAICRKAVIFKVDQKLNDVVPAEVLSALELKKRADVKNATKYKL